MLSRHPLLMPGFGDLYALRYIGRDSELPLDAIMDAAETTVENCQQGDIAVSVISQELTPAIKARLKHQVDMDTVRPGDKLMDVFVATNGPKHNDATPVARMQRDEVILRAAPVGLRLNPLEHDVEQAARLLIDWDMQESFLTSPANPVLDYILPHKDRLHVLDSVLDFRKFAQ